MTREDVISDLEQQISWIRDNDFHKFPGWGHAVLAMRDAIELLKAKQDTTTLVHFGTKYSQTFRCEKCNRFSFYPQRYVKLSPMVTTNEYQYCPYCGRAVKWE